MAEQPGPGSRLGAYRLVAPIGTGGMGRVWAALDEGAPELHLLALKVALNEEGGDGTDRQYWSALSDEAGVAARIQHPNVCRTYELGMSEGVHFLVMEWSDGASLRDLLDALPEKRVSPAVAAYVGIELAAGLHAAHELVDEEGQSLGVVHRDVSPQNVLISTHGDILLADFGVAKARGQQRRPTETGELKGKLSYMAPEQISSKNIDRRADVFALGCVVYEAALGARAFHGADALSTMYRILEEPVVAPRTLDPNFPPSLEAILLKALAKEVNERYQSAEELRQALIGFLVENQLSVSEQVVAQLLDGAMGSVLGERNRALRATAERIRRGERLSAPLPLAGPGVSATPSGGIERSVTQPRAVERSRAGLLSIVVALVVLAVLVGVLLGRRNDEAKSEPPLGSSSSVALPAAAPVVDTASALGSAPAPLTSAGADAPPIEEEPEPGRLRPPRGRGKPPAAGASQPAATPPAPPGPGPAPHELPPPRGKPVRPPRTIDQSNPFAQP